MMAEHDEIINRVEVLESGELILVLESGGRSGYQHIYREGVGVSWDNKRGAFKSTSRVKWSYPEWFFHILNTCNSDNVYYSICLGSEVDWVNISEQDKEEIEKGSTT